MRIAIVQPNAGALTETFIHAHRDHLRGERIVVHDTLPQIEGKPVLTLSLPLLARLGIAYVRGVRPTLGWTVWASTCGYIEAIRRIRPDVVLAEYGRMGVRVLEGCRRYRIPLVVHFHGVDATHRDVLAMYHRSYLEMFDYASAIIVVSEPMREQLIQLGAPASKIRLNAYGVDCDQFRGSNPRTAEPHLLAVGRFVEKKGPHLTLLAFARVIAQCPDARLTMIGTGPLLSVCRDLARALGIAPRVDFPGAQPHDQVKQAMRQARAFVQHSLRAEDGDCEGLPNSVLEASASGLPVIATRHAGIPEAVVHSHTGLLVDERDVVGMAAAMRQLCDSPALAGSMGAAGRERMQSQFALGDRIASLEGILKAAISKKLPRAG